MEVLLQVITAQAEGAMWIRAWKMVLEMNAARADGNGYPTAVTKKALILVLLEMIRVMKEARGVRDMIYADRTILMSVHMGLPMKMFAMVPQKENMILALAGGRILMYVQRE